jgi:hypothetical protein
VAKSQERDSAAGVGDNFDDDAMINIEGNENNMENFLSFNYGGYS